MQRFLHWKLLKMMTADHIEQVTAISNKNIKLNTFFPYFYLGPVMEAILNLLLDAFLIIHIFVFL
jgi:hypothetical protein